VTFQHPHLLWALLALPVLGWLWWLAALRRHRRLACFIGRETWPVLNRSVSTVARRWKAVLLFGAVALAIVAGARPQWGTRERLVRERGIDIIVAMDVSRSMLAADIAPSRLEQAKMRFRQLLATIPGQRVGILPFAGQAFLQCPLTTDYGVAMSYLANLGPDTVGVPGTNIAAAIERAREAFEQGGVSDNRILILITDGESHEGDAHEQARLAAQAGIRIFALGIGTPEGAPIVLPDGSLAEDRQGRKILTRLDAALLRDIANITGGHAYIARPGENLDIRPLAEKIRSLQASDFGPDNRRRVLVEERYQIPLAMALGLLFIEALLGDRRRLVPRTAGGAS
jgi:Ca-activated chloride channel family protein